MFIIVVLIFGNIFGKVVVLSLIIFIFLGFLIMLFILVLILIFGFSFINFVDCKSSKVLLLFVVLFGIVIVVFCFNWLSFLIFWEYIFIGLICILVIYVKLRWCFFEKFLR